MLYAKVRKDEEVNALLNKGNANLRVLGFTDHSVEHTSVVAERSAMILDRLGYSAHEQELARVAGYMHDIGNAINRKHHAEYGGILANDILKRYDISIEDRVTIASAISNHDESTGRAVDAISAALIIADKTDVRRNRVCNDIKDFDIHDRVNYAVVGANLKIDVENKVISLNLQIDEEYCNMYDYFEIFLGRMMMCRNAAAMLGTTFKLKANGSKIL